MNPLSRCPQQSSAPLAAHQAANTDGIGITRRSEQSRLCRPRNSLDLVFYHVKLKCYVVIDLKVGKLAHGDLGQMLLYVNYYDREVAAKDDSPTIGLILCSEKNDAVVRYVLADKSNQIFASRYQFHLPSEDDLRAEMRRELALFGREASKELGVPAVPPINSDGSETTARQKSTGTRRSGAAKR